MNYAIILAGGRGVRFGNGDIPKQFIDYTGIPMVVYSMQTAEMNQNIDEVCVVTLKRFIPQIDKWIKEYDIRKVKYIVESGIERYDSVYNGLCGIPAVEDDTVMIMTAVCPLLSQNTINEHYNRMLNGCNGVITVVKATDAITYSDNGKEADKTLQKEKLFVQQGPQTYRYGVLKKAHDSFRMNQSKQVFEDSELVLDMGIEVDMVIGDRFCLKVTYPEDLAIVKALYPLFCEKENRRLHAQYNH